MLRFTFREPVMGVKNAKLADPNAIGQEFERIALANGGRLTPRAALDAARNRRNVLHKHIEWDDSVAAEIHRRNQISELIRIIVREDDAAGVRPARAFYSITDKDGASYRRVDEVLGNKELQLLLLRQAERDLKAWQLRYAELHEVIGLVESARERLASKIKHVEDRGKKSSRRTTSSKQGEARA